MENKVDFTQKKATVELMTKQKNMSESFAGSLPSSVRKYNYGKTNIEESPQS